MRQDCHDGDLIVLYCIVSLLTTLLNIKGYINHINKSENKQEELQTIKKHLLAGRTDRRAYLSFKWSMPYNISSFNWKNDQVQIVIAYWTIQLKQ